MTNYKINTFDYVRNEFKPSQTENALVANVNRYNDFVRILKTLEKLTSSNSQTDFDSSATDDI